jgi:hypothetical protein
MAQSFGFNRRATVQVGQIANRNSLYKLKNRIFGQSPTETR